MPNETGLQPKRGVRFLFERTADGGERADYAAAILTAGARVDYRAALHQDGSVELIPTGERAPGDLEEKLARIAGVIARGATNKRADGLAPWPHRVLRWRKA